MGSVTPTTMRLFLLVSVLSLAGVGFLTRPTSIPPGEEGVEEMVEGTVELPARGVPVQNVAGGGIEAGVFVDTSERSYRLSGGSASEILASLREGGPHVGGEHFFGLTKSESSFQLQPRIDGATCVADDVRIELAIEITLPEWTPAGDVPYELQRDWTRFSTALKRHEDGHRQIAVDGAEATRTALDGVRGASCEEVQLRARQLAQRIANETEAEHHRYDDQTGHGRTQGAEWPVR